MARGKLPIFDRRAEDGRLMGYQVKIRKPGFPSISRQFDRKADAERFAIDTLRDMNSGTWVDRREAERTSLLEALERYEREVTPAKKSAESERHVIARWKRHALASRSLASLRPGDFAGFRDARLSEGKSPNTVRIELALVSHLFRKAIREWGMGLTANPLANIDKPKLPGGRTRRLIRDADPKKDEQARLFNACEESRSRHLLPVVKLALETAMRRGELVGLRWGDIDLAGRVARLIDTKNGDSRDVPLSPAAVEILNGLPRSIDGRVFALDGKTLEHTFRRAVAKAGLDDFTFHDLRHEATSRLVESGRFTVVEVAAITGHKSMQMLKRYTHPRATDLAAKLAAPAPGTAPAAKRGRPKKAVVGDVVAMPVRGEHG